MSRLLTLYNEKIVPELMEKLELKNKMSVPRITKVTLNMGVGEAVNDKKIMTSLVIEHTSKLIMVIDKV